jgi:hypothetical protein
MGPENADGASDAFDEGEEGGLMDLLREANLSTRHLKFCCGGVLVVAVLVGLFFGGRAALDWWQNRPETPVEEDPVENDEPKDDDVPEDYSFLDPSLISGLMVGTAVPDDDATSTIGENLGSQEYKDEFTQQIGDFAKIYEGLQTDVNELLNKSTDRYESLKDFEDELNYLQYLARQNAAQLQADAEALADKFSAVEENKDEKEASFFAQLKDLNAPAASAALEAFIAEAEDVVRLRAEFNARDKLLGYYEQALAALETKIKDITLNEEALIKGVQVVEVDGSDLNLIIDEGDL